MICFFLFSGKEAFSFFFGDIQTGLNYVQESKKTGYYLYVPKNFSQEKTWPLVVALGEWGKDTEKYCQLWGTYAEQEGYLVLCPLWPKFRDEVPEVGDKWLLKVVRKVASKYQADSGRILLTGFSDGADYAHYLALRYPKKFSAAAIIGGALNPVYDQLIYYGDIKRNPLPFLFINGKEDVDLRDRSLTPEYIQKSVQKLRDAKVDVDYQEVDGLAHEYRGDFNSKILQWFESKGRG